MATYTLGQAAIVNKGAWSSSTPYAILNTVTHSAGSFMAIKASTGIEPGVTSGWATYWVAMAKGIKTVTVTALNSTTAQMTVTFSDGTTATSGTFNTAVVAPGAIGTTELGTGSVTAVKLGSDILPANVGIKYGTATPTTSTISAGQIYLKYS